MLGAPPMVIGWSALGSPAAMLYQFLNRPVGQLDTIKWLVARAIQGIIMGSFLYLVATAGLLVLVNPHAPWGQTTQAAVGSLAEAIRPELGAIIARPSDRANGRAAMVTQPSVTGNWSTL